MVKTHVINQALNRVQNVSREMALTPAESNSEERIPFILTYHPNSLAAKNIILRNFSILQSDPATASIFSQPPLVSFKRDKNLQNLLVRSALRPTSEPGTFKCSRKQVQNLSVYCFSHSNYRPYLHISGFRPFCLYQYQFSLLHHLFSLSKTLHRRNWQKTR